MSVLLSGRSNAILNPLMVVRNVGRQASTLTTVFEFVAARLAISSTFQPRCIRSFLIVSPAGVTDLVERRLPMTRPSELPTEWLQTGSRAAGGFGGTQV